MSFVKKVLSFMYGECQVPTKAAPSLPSSTGHGRENGMKGLWAEINAGRDLSPATVMGKTDPTEGNQFNLLPVVSE